MQHISLKIDNIINNRKENLPFIKKTLENINHCEKIISFLKNTKTKLTIHNKDNQYLDIIEKLDRISLDNFYLCYKNYEQQLIKLQKRFSREEIHISFVGRAGQGKSLVLQNISGLNSSVIPSAEGSDCTGAKSVITNIDSDNTYAKITFFSNIEIIDIINTYLENILYNQNYNIHSIDEISNIPIDIVRNSIDYSKVEESSRLTHLCKYIEHINEFKDYLGKTIKVNEYEIEQYVAQYNHNDTSQKYYKYLGVKIANIFCKFPHKDTGKIVLVDTIGIGATSIGVENSMLDTVENDSDAIVFMFRPDSLRTRISTDEIDIIQNISQKITPEYAKEMLFWVINKVESGKGENVKCIPELKQRIDSEKYPIADTLVVNCASKQEVEDKLLIPILNRISERINEVDKFIIDNTNKLAYQLIEEFNKIVLAINSIHINNYNNNIQREMNPIIEKTRDIGLLNNIRELYLHKYKDMREKSCKEFENAINETLYTLLTFVPTKETVITILENGRNNQHNTLEDCTNILRINIINEFLKLDNILDKIVISMKNDVIHVFADDDKGKLGNIVEYNNITPNQWINLFLEKIGETEYPLISTSLRAFRDFNFSVKGFLIFEVRNELDIIDFSLRKQLPILNNNLENLDATSEEIVEILMDNMGRIYDKLEDNICSFYKIPNRAMFAAIKDLYDRIAFLDNKNVQNEWRYLYEEFMRDIWPDKYENHASKKEIVDIWNELKRYLNEYDENLFFIRID